MARSPDGQCCDLRTRHAVWRVAAAADVDLCGCTNGGPVQWRGEMDGVRITQAAKPLVEWMLDLLFNLLIAAKWLVVRMAVCELSNELGGSSGVLGEPCWSWLPWPLDVSFHSLLHGCCPLLTAEVCRKKGDRLHNDGSAGHIGFGRGLRRWAVCRRCRLAVACYWDDSWYSI